MYDLTPSTTRIPFSNIMSGHSWQTGGPLGELLPPVEMQLAYSEASPTGKLTYWSFSYFVGFLKIKLNLTSLPWLAIEGLLGFILFFMWNAVHILMLVGLHKQEFYIWPVVCLLSNFEKLQFDFVVIRMERCPYTFPLLIY